MLETNGTNQLCGDVRTEESIVRHKRKIRQKTQQDGNKANTRKRPSLEE